MIKTLQAAFNEKPVAENDKAFVVSKSWVRRGLELGSDPKLARKEMPDDGLGPVDNSDIILQVLVDRDGKPFVRLNPGTDLEICELFCEDAWDLIHKWYGLKDGQYPIERKAVNTQADPRCPANIEYELNPPVFRIHRLWSLHSGIEIPEEGRNLLPLLMVRSRGESFHQFLKDIKKTLRINLAIEIRLWEVVRALPATSSATAHNPQDSWQKLLLEVTAWSEFDYNRRVKIEAPDSTRNPKYNGKSRLSTFNLATDKTLVVEEAVGDDGWVSTKSSLASRPNNRAPRPSNIATTSRTNSGRASPALSGPVTRGRAKKKKGGRGTGAVGLGNLGNTCYMNSALQCVRSVEELTKYFLTGEYAEEINEQNHLGYGGKMAIAYGHLLADMYNTSNDSVRPSNFKSTAGSIRPAFASWGQQDSQEFLGFLLDALQEDLSRVKKKPYIEKPDSTDDMVHDEAAIAKMADEVWDITMKRDDSVISDLFTGLYKSTLKCPACHKISITFDPFNNLTLPLPIENPWAKAVKFYPLNDCPVEIEVEIPQHSGVDVLKRFISDRTGVPVERLIGAEEFKCKFFKMYDDTTDVSDEIQNTDIPTVHELEVQPSNWPPKPVARAKQHQKVRSMLEFETPESDEDPFDDARYDHMVVPVLHRRDNKQTRISYLHKDNGLPPHFIVLNREEVWNPARQKRRSPLLTLLQARSEDAIRRKVLERVATFTTWDGFQGDDGDTAENTDAEMTLASDADSGDSKVVAKSVEGEDDMVDVSMNGVAKDPPAMAPKNP
jgi:ubiquitin carboxyl-terminal hydrolase 4/11/15